MKILYSIEIVPESTFVVTIPFTAFWHEMEVVATALKDYEDFVAWLNVGEAPEDALPHSFGTQQFVHETEGYLTRSGFVTYYSTVRIPPKFAQMIIVSCFKNFLSLTCTN